jgi:RHS repeat-associated protein
MTNQNNTTIDQSKNADTAEHEDCGCGCGGCADGTSSEPVNLVKEGTVANSHVAIMQNAVNAVIGNGKDVPPTKIEPGKWVPVPPQKGVDPDAARVLIEGRAPPANVYDPNKKAVHSVIGGFGESTTIAELARALKNNIDLIFEWAYNNINYLPTYGIQKGGLGAIIDGFGNSFDLSDLIVQLARQAGYTANYQFGTLRMTAAQAGSWLGTDPLNIWAANNLLANSGVPVTVVTVSGVDYIEFSHCWALVNVGGTNYVFDAAIRSHTSKTAINLATAMGYNATNFLTRAKSGATVTSDYVKNLNRANIRADLDTMTMNLVNWIKTNNHGAFMDDILGGRTIVPNDASTPTRITAHPRLKPSSTVTTWTAVPQAYKATLHIVYDSIDITFNSHDLAGKRLTLTFNASHQGELRLNGTLLGTSAAQTPGSWNSVLFDIVHPYPFTWANQYVWHRVWADKPYLLCQSWGNLTPGAVNLHSQRVKKLIADIAVLDGEPMIGEVMAQMYKTMDAGVSRMAEILNRMANCTTTMHHQCGLIGWYDTVFTDIGAISWSTSALDNNYNQQQAMDTTLAIHGVALESQVVKEYQKADGVSSIAVLDKANQLGKKIYDARTSNWLTTVRPSLVNYSTSDLNDIENYRINYGDRVALPEDGAITIGSWTGFGYNDIPAYGTYGIIGGGLKGGASSKAIGLTSLSYVMSAWSWDVGVTPPYPGVDCTTLSAQYKNSTCFPWLGSGGMGRCVCWVPNGTVDFNGTFLPGGGSGGLGLLTNGGGSSSAASGNSSGYIGGLYGQFGANQGGGGSDFAKNYISRDPIDLNGNNYIIDATDLEIGSQPYPYGLSFIRHYSSSGINQHGPLGRGWRHNWMINAGVDTSGLSGMGDHSILASAGVIVEAFVSYNLQTDLTKPFEKYLTTVLNAMWFVNYLSGNVVTVNRGVRSSQFHLLPDGTFASPAGTNDTLSKNSDGTFTITTLTGSKLNFNSIGQLSSIVESRGVTISLSYNTDGQLQTISNGLSRSLSLTYSPNKQLQSVSDSSGRSVSYTLDTNMNLTTFTDADGKNTTYQYDQPGRITKVFRPANPSTAILTNLYDTLGRIKEQWDFQSNIWQYLFAGSRSEEINPNGKSKIIYFNGFGLAGRLIDQSGNKEICYYDGRNRLIKSIAPENNSSEYEYDNKDRLTKAVNKPKPSSGLANIITSYTYDPICNKLKSETDPLSRVTTYTYDPANGNLLSITLPSVSGVGIPQTTFTYNSRGQILTQTTPDGMVSKFIYDSSNETLLSNINDFGSGRLNLTCNFTYTPTGDLATSQDARGFTTSYQYDVMRRHKQTTAPSPLSYVTKISYDANGNKTKVERQTNSVITPWRTTETTFDANNNITSLKSPLGQITTFTYDNLQRLSKTIDPLLRETTRTYDDNDRLKTVIDPQSNVTSTYTYTSNGLMSSVKDAKNNITLFTYDGFDRSKRTTYPDGSYEEKTSYDLNSNLLSIRLRSANTISFTYDELNRVKTKSPTGQAVVTKNYDLVGNLISVSTPVISGNPASGTYGYSFDTAGRAYKETYPDGKSVITELDANGNITKINYPDGTYFIIRVYDELNRLQAIKLNGSASNALTFQYNALSQRTKLIYENGTSVDYSYDLNGNISSMAYSFNATSLTVNYLFDNADQASSQSMSDSSFMWHPGGSGTVVYGSTNSLNQYPSIGTISQTYTTDGSTANNGNLKFEYNTERFIQKIRNAATNTTILDFLYDPLLRQRQKKSASATTNYYYIGWQRLADFDGAGNLLNRYIYGSSMDEVLLQIDNAGVKTFLYSNHQLSVIATANAAGSVTNKYKYGIFGETSALTGISHGFSGQRFDPETGIYYFKLRYYSPNTGKFIQPDPEGYRDNLNLYTYCLNNPITSIDPYGTTVDKLFTYEVLIKPVYYPDKPFRTIGWHASLIVTETTYDTLETTRYTKTETTTKYYDFAAGNLQGKVGQYLNEVGERDFKGQMEEGEVIWHQEDKDGSLLAKLKQAALTWKPEGTQKNYWPTGNQYLFGLFGSNSNNYVAYLIASIGGKINPTGIRHTTPGIHSPTNSTNTTPVKGNGWWESEQETSTNIHYAYKEGG